MLFFLFFGRLRAMVVLAWVAFQPVIVGADAPLLAAHRAYNPRDSPAL